MLTAAQSNSLTETASSLSSHLSSSHVATGIATVAGITILAILFIGLIVANVLFCLSAHRAVNRVPKDKQLFPAWLIWLVFVPFVGYVIAWMMIPFGIPTSFNQAVGDNPQAVNESKTLFGLGLAYVILTVLVFVPFVGVLLCLPASFIIWIIYWTKMVGFKNKYLTQNGMLNPR